MRLFAFLFVVIFYLIHLLWSLNRSCFSSSHSYIPTCRSVPIRSVHPTHVQPRFVSPINSRKSKFEIRRWQMREVRSTIDWLLRLPCFDGPSSDTDLSKRAHFKGHSHRQSEPDNVAKCRADAAEEADEAEEPSAGETKRDKGKR